MTSQTPSFSGRLIQRLAQFVAPRHSDLVRGMVAELEVITDPAERTRFTLGALTAIARLSVQRPIAGASPATSRSLPVHSSGAGGNAGGLLVSPITTRQLARRHLVSFGLSFLGLTALLLALSGSRLGSQLGKESTAGMAEVIVLAIPFNIAMTVPMAIFLSVAWVFSRLGAHGMLVGARDDASALRPLLLPVLVGASIIAALMFVSNTLVLPRANSRLASVLAGKPLQPSDRTMSVGELRAAAQQARAEIGATGQARAAAYEVEVQKKFALSAACIVLALAGAAIALRFPRGGVWLVTGSSIIVFLGYYVALIAGESLADRQMVSPVPAMWMANALALVLAWLLVRPASRTHIAPIVS